MKQKFYLLFAFILFVSAVWSQETRFGVTGGLSLASWTAKAGGVSINSQSNTGFTAGVTAFVPLTTQFTIQTGLNFLQKGAKTDDQGDVEKIKLNYIELPVNFLYTHEGFFGGVGPTFAMGISGTDNATSQGVTQKTDLHFGNSTDDDLTKFDIGANITAGYMVPSGWMISLNYNFGLSNLIPGGNSSDGKVTNRYFGIRIGYIFQK
jgi:hypothetical protein